MKCNWCKNDAVKVGSLPDRTIGPEFLFSCMDHEYLIKALEYDLANFQDVIDEMNRRERANRYSIK